jgi:hypothetical protein
MAVDEKIKTDTHNNTIITFDPEPHVYTLDSGEKLISATSLIGKFFGEFDADLQAERMSSSFYLPKSAIQEKWSGTGMLAASEGTCVHWFAEHYIKYQTDKNQMNTLMWGKLQKILDTSNVSPSLKRISKLCNQVKNFIDIELLPNYKIIALEKILFSKELGICGTADLLATKDDTLFVLDWKTCEKEIIKENKYNKFGSGPLKTVDDTKYAHYEVQLNLYRGLIISEKYFPEFENIEMEFFHITDKSVKRCPVKKMGTVTSKVFTYIKEKKLQLDEGEMKKWTLAHF